MSLILGIESSCDETAAALVTSDRRILAHRLAGQEAAHRPYGGVVPEIAARAHVEILPRLVEETLAEAGIALDEVDAIAATAGPGLIGGVMVGLVTAKGLALASGKKLVAVNHLEGHALSPMLSDPDLAFPYLLLLVSGGHTQLLTVKDVGSYTRLGTTLDDALGEAFDKAAKLLGLGYPGGPAVEECAKRGRAIVSLPRPMLGRPEPHFSLAGLKTALRHEAMKREPLGEQDVADLCASFQEAAADVVSDRTRHAMELYVDALGPEAQKALVVAGGVAANQRLRAALAEAAAEQGFTLILPPAELCTDNAAMVAWAGAERLARGLVDDLAAPSRARWPLDPDAAPAIGAGIKA